VRTRPALTYLVDVGISTTFGAMAAASVRSRIVIDTGDLAYALARSTGSRGAPGLFAVWLGERVVLRLADHVVVRGTEHVRMVSRPATFVPDLAPANARPLDGSRIRRDLGLDDAYVVGLVGSLKRAPRLGTSYGWDLVESLRYAPENVTALIVGDGDARPDLEARAREMGLADRCLFPGFVEPDELPEWVGAMDAALSTQTNDDVGAVRTTTKLPLYLACGRPVLASDVGEARRLLGPLGWTIRYDGVVDREYPRRLAAKIEEWSSQPELRARQREDALRLAREEFDADVVRRRVGDVIDRLLEAGTGRGPRRTRAARLAGPSWPRR
jgi:glycosyltransferase involved in cell wall biosynthesis